MALLPHVRAMGAPPLEYLEHLKESRDIAKHYAEAFRLRHAAANNEAAADDDLRCSEEWKSYAQKMAAEINAIRSRLRQQKHRA